MSLTEQEIKELERDIKRERDEEYLQEYNDGCEDND
jgi:hypothetical protein